MASQSVLKSPNTIRGLPQQRQVIGFNVVNDGSFYVYYNEKF